MAARRLIAPRPGDAGGGLKAVAVATSSPTASAQHPRISRPPEAASFGCILRSGNLMLFPSKEIDTLAAGAFRPGISSTQTLAAFRFGGRKDFPSTP
eukprot:scaffold100821_cov60-Phaeocystis_antarctica.AAC.2